MESTIKLVTRDQLVKDYINAPVHTVHTVPSVPGERLNNILYIDDVFSLNDNIAET